MGDITEHPSSKVVVIELGWVFMNGLSQLDPEMKFFWGPILKDILPRLLEQL